MTRRRVDENRLAARAVAIHDRATPRQRKTVLDALGLLDSTGRDVVPSPARVSQAALDEFGAAAVSFGGERDSGMWQDHRVRPRDLSLVPPGLRDYAPAPEPRLPRRRGKNPPVSA